ncbi:hypothetical protein MtrunA17_Chr4g0029511 [Medicago truncatula]|uniref:Transmembrane protein n=1 Tax=Medicago truncatula TaxID=3880 RepID=A0A396IAT6_MEDTR|nr:hypothetical protein MtrunA17_Chr4g0029511 [Medicago truncatula]
MLIYMRFFFIFVPFAHNSLFICCFAFLLNSRWRLCLLWRAFLKNSKDKKARKVDDPIPKVILLKKFIGVIKGKIMLVVWCLLWKLRLRLGSLRHLP